MSIAVKGETPQSGFFLKNDYFLLQSVPFVLSEQGGRCNLDGTIEIVHQPAEI